MAGNRRMLLANGLALPRSAKEQGEAYAAEGKTPLYFAANRQVAGVFAVADVLKPTSRTAVRALQALGVEVTLLTGDNQATAQSIATELGIRDVIAEVLPQDKERIVREKQAKGHKVAMVGDGINDAPALARADVGIAIGAGTDVAISSADVVLMKSDLMDAVDAIRLSRQTMRNIRQNLFWAFFYNCIGIPIAAGVLWIPLGLKLSPMIGAAAMSLSSVDVYKRQAFVIRQLFERAARFVRGGEDAVLGAGLAVFFLAELFENAEGNGRLGRRARLGDDVDAEIAVADDLDHVVEVRGGDVAADKVNLRDALRTHAVVHLAVYEFDRCARAQIRAADADHDQHVAGLLDLPGRRLDAVSYTHLIRSSSISSSATPALRRSSLIRSTICSSQERSISSVTLEPLPGLPVLPLGSSP